MAVESRWPVFLLAFATDRDDRASYLRSLPEEARQIRADLGPSERVVVCNSGTSTPLSSTIQSDKAMVGIRWAFLAVINNLCSLMDASPSTSQ
jgi:hypothetical protein